MDDEHPETIQPLPLPQSISELEALIQRFYGLNTPQEYTQIDNCLKSVQRTHGAFALADQLMSSADPNVRFFGALTFTVKINRDWTSLNASEGKDLLERLLFWFVKCVNAHDVSLVVRKLCSALVALFKQTDGQWILCVAHAMVCLAKDAVVEYADAVSGQDLQGVVNSLSDTQATACLWLGSALVEEVSKIESSNIQGDKVIKTASQNLPALLDIVEYCLRSDTSEDHRLIQDAIKLLHTLRASNQQFTNDDTESKSRLSNVTLNVVSQLAADDLLPTIADLAIDIMGRDSSRQIAQLVATKLVESQFVQYQFELQEGNFDEDHLIYGRILVTTAATWVDDQPDENAWILPHLDEILERLIFLAQSSGYPIEDDTLIPEILDFWSSYVEWALDLNASAQQTQTKVQEWRNQSVNYTSRVLEAFLKKLQIPPQDIFSKWDRQSQAEFRALRRDFRHFSASAYILLGTSMLETLVNYLLRIWAERNWQGVEITLQCLKGVIEAVVDTENGDAALIAFLTSPAFSTDENEIPINIRQTNIELVSDCSPFFERQPEAPMRILQWLFESLSNQTLSLPAAKAISAICDSCRKKLITHGPDLSNLYCSLAADKTQQSDVIERLALAVGAVIQALWVESKSKPDRSVAIQALDSMLNVTMNQLLVTEGHNTPEARSQQMTVLQSLVNIAKAFQKVEDGFVDLDEDEPSPSGSDPATLQWISKRQKDFTEVLRRLLQNLPSNGDLMEVICLSVRAGTTGDDDNPFKVNEQILACLVSDYLRITERPGFLLETVSRWLRPSLSWNKSKISEVTGIDDRRNDVAKTCLSEALTCLEYIHNSPDGPSNHAEHISSIVEFTTTYIQTTDISHLVANDKINNLFIHCASIAIQCFTLPEPILKQAASTFWADLLEVRPVAATSTDDPAALVQHNIVQLLPILVKTLVHALSGLAARSELDMITSPFRRLIVFPIPRQNHTQTDNATSSRIDLRSLLSSALSSPDFPSTRVGEQDKKMFLEKVLRLRGDAAGTKKVCKEWWVACRGTFS